MLNESEWNEKKKVLVDIYERKNSLGKEEIESLLKSELVKDNGKEDFGENISCISEKYSLSVRESDVLKELSAGLSNSQISGVLSVSVSTVKKHVYSIFNKVGVNSRSQLLNMLFRNWEK